MSVHKHTAALYLWVKRTGQKNEIAPVASQVERTLKTRSVVRFDSEIQRQNMTITPKMTGQSGPEEMQDQ